VVAASQERAATSNPPVLDDFSGELPRIPPVPPDETIETFRVAGGFRIDLVAAEPDVVDPVALDFDEHGRLFVVEMRGYSEQGDGMLGRVRLLEDHDADGRFEESTVFVDKLSWPTAVLCYDGGVFVGAAPDILYLKDTNGDGRADLRRVVFSGFGRGNVQGLLNSFRWGLDNRIHGATSSAGARVVRRQEPGDGGQESGEGGEGERGTEGNVDSSHSALRTPNSALGHSALRTPHSALDLRGRDFAFDPRTLDIVATSGGGQHGMTFDEWDTKFVCSNSDHVQQVMFEDRYAARNPYVVPPPPRQSIAADGPQADVFRISPVEPWRLVRTRLRVAGAVPGPIERGGKAAGYFTSATGLTIYDGNAWPREYDGLAIVGDVGGNLIHRKRLVADGVRFTAHRIDERSEFVASSDIWFRPVQFAVGPDGGLYVADMYREVIEHPDSLPPVIKRHLDLTSGQDRGRIYRIVPDDFQQPPPVRLGEATTDDLVGLLAHENGWHRRTAARLLIERADAEAIPPLMRLALTGESAVGRIHSLYVLESLSALDAATLRQALDDSHPRVRAHAVRLTETNAFHDSRVRARLIERASDPSPHVHLQVAFSLGELESDDARNAALAELLVEHGDDPYVRFAVLSSLMKGAESVAALLRRDAAFAASQVGKEIQELLAAQLERQQRSREGVTQFARRTDSDPAEMIRNENPERQRVVEQYQVALTTAGDADRGREIYRRLCINCHQLEGEGTPLGPNLAAAANRGSDAVLLAILDPNREIDPRFTQHVVTTSAGKTYAGALTSETATSITLADGENSPRTILKIDIESLENTQKSIMPEGMEKEISVEQMADLLVFLQIVE
jgi:putative membrane-bound dehydrogenase-like protein